MTSILTIIYTCFSNVPNGCSLHDVPDDKLLDGFVFGHTTGTVGASDGLGVSTALLGASVIPPLLGLEGE